MVMKRVLTLLAVVGCALCAGAAKTETVVSPNGKIKMEVKIGRAHV